MLIFSEFFNGFSLAWYSTLISDILNCVKSKCPSVPIMFFPTVGHSPLSVIPHSHLAFVHHLSFSTILYGLSFPIVCHSTHLPNLRTMDPLSVILNYLLFWIIYHFPLSVISHCLSITSYNLRTIDLSEYAVITWSISCLVAMQTNCNTWFPSNQEIG